MPSSDSAGSYAQGGAPPFSQQPAANPGYLDGFQGGFDEQSGYMDQLGGQGMGTGLDFGDDDLLGADFLVCEDLDIRCWM